MQPGDVLDRYELEQRAGAGGMGEVFRARDRASGQRVAIKVLHKEYADDAARFLREANALARLSHRGIVRYMAQGIVPTGAPYLVMEWLDGEDLAARLRRGRLSVDEALAVMTGAAEALAVVHGCGIVHRDLKPQNLFLVSGDVAQVKLLDFGIARLPEATRMTRSGVILGTPAYMAPEQASSGQPIDARADVFALGCVLFECLTGEPAFAGAHVMEVLLKIVLQEAPRPCEIRPEVPSRIDALCARMLAKDPDARPRDGAAVAAAIEALGYGATLPDAEARRPAEPFPVSLTHQERRVRSVLLIGLNGGRAQPDADTCITAPPEEMHREVAARGGQIDPLADGSILITLSGAGLATDQAARSARCALSLRALASDRPIALASGRAELSGRLPGSDLIDRAIQTLAQAALPAGSAQTTGRAASIAIDEVTAGLLDARFSVTETDTGLWLHGERPLAKGARTLLGKPTACVGRDWEIGTLDALLSECIEASRPRVALLTAPAGVGKTRIAYELVRRVEQRDDPIALWIGRGDPQRAGAPLGLLSQALQGALRIHDGEPLDVRRDRLQARVRERVGAGDARRVSEFLGELLGTPFPDEDSVQLRAARGDARLLGDQMRMAWVDFLGATCASQPLLLVLEDLHWGDLPTVQYIGEALRCLEDKPWLVLALARPEVHELFPRLWSERDVMEIRLKSLSHKAAARLVQQALGDGVGAETVERLVVQASGNAFYLEELIRATADGSAGALPETVLAMVQSRLEALDDGSRRLLRAASVFGKVFWRGAIDALLGGGASSTVIEGHLDRLEQQEWIYGRAESRFEGERELVFRHDLVREAAYGMLTEDDRALGHRLAGEWLVRAAEPSAAAIADHFDRGGAPARAVAFYRTAAAQALVANDLGTVIARTGRALALGAGGEARGEMLLLQAEAHHFRGEIALAEERAMQAMAVLPPDTPAWYAALGETANVGGRLGHNDRLDTLGEALRARWSRAASSAQIAATARTATVLLAAGGYALADALVERLREIEACIDDPSVQGRVYHALATRALIAGDLSAHLEGMIAATACHERAGDLRNLALGRGNVGYAYLALGAYAPAETALRAALAIAARLNLPTLVAHAQHNLGLVLARLGDLDQAVWIEREAVQQFVVCGDIRLAGGARSYLAVILHEQGALDEAAREAEEAASSLESAQPIRAYALAMLARVRLSQDRTREALRDATEAAGVLATLGAVEEGASLVRLVHAEALRASGETAAARAAILDAKARLLADAAKIRDPALRDSFLRNVPEHARTLELAAAWLGADGA